MSTPAMSTDAKHAPHLAEDSKTMFGFWLYLMTDCILFASLFATFVVLRGGTFGGPSGSELFDMPFVLTETLILLTSSFVCGLAILAARRGKKQQVLIGLGGTIALGLAFLGMEITEFAHLASEGHGWQASAFLSAFFTLVGTHGAHIAVGLLWAGVLVWRLLQAGLTTALTKKLTLFALFWHFLDVVWIFIFTIVYLMGAV